MKIDKDTLGNIGVALVLGVTYAGLFLVGVCLAALPVLAVLKLLGKI